MYRYVDFNVSNLKLFENMDIKIASYAYIFYFVVITCQFYVVHNTITLGHEIRLFYIQSIYQEVTVQEPIINDVIKTVKESLKTKEPGDEKDVLQSTIVDIEKRWNELHKNVVSRHAIIRKIYPFAEQFNYETEKLLPWLLTADKEARLIQPLSSQSVELIQQKRAIEVIVSDFVFVLLDYQQL